MTSTNSADNAARDAGLSRRTLIRAGVGTAGAVLVTGAGGWAANAATPDNHGGHNGGQNVRKISRDRAQQSWTALQTHLLAADGSHLAFEHYPKQDGDQPYSYEWPLSQVHVGALDLLAMQPGRASRDRLTAVAAGQEHYWETTSSTGKPGYASYPIAPFGGGGDLFYDDNAWVALEKIQLYLMTHDRSALARAEEIFTLLVSGWDTDASHPAPGGVFWTQAPWSTARNTVSNMPAALIGARLYQITRKPEYLDFAKKCYEWTNNTLLDTDSLYFDNIELDGTVDHTKWSYNQGIPLAAALELYKATGDRTYLQQSCETAEASLDYYVAQGKLSTQPIYFNSIYFKSLLLLSATTGDRKYYNAMAAYGDQLWNDYRDASTGLFAKDKPGVAQSLEQGAAVQIFAVLGWHQHQWSLIY